MSWTVNLEIRSKTGGAVPDDLVERYVLLETDDIEERERFVERLRKRLALGDFHDSVEGEDGEEDPDD